MYALRLRVGLNSGGITAGVLRGEVRYPSCRARAVCACEPSLSLSLSLYSHHSPHPTPTPQRGRLQLFGDTINTASRMESNSLPGRIQASQATYNLLCGLGYSDWGQPREELVEAKGKGFLQTYWITPPDAVRVKMQTKALGKRNKHLVSTLLVADHSPQKMVRSPSSSALSPVRSLLTRMSSSLLSTTSSGEDSSSMLNHITPLSSFYRARPNPNPSPSPTTSFAQAASHPSPSGSALDEHAVEKVFADLDNLAAATGGNYSI